MSAGKTLSEATALLEPIGFEPVGMNENNHFVFRHTETGAVARVGTAKLASKKHRANIVNQAQRGVRHAQSVSHRWVNWLIDEYGIAEDEEREVSISIPRMTERFLDENPELRGRTSRGLWLIALRNNPQATLIKPAPRGIAGGSSLWKLRGPLFGVRPVEDPAITEAREQIEKRIEQDKRVAKAMEPITTELGGVYAQTQEAGDEGRDEPADGVSDRGVGGLVPDESVVSASVAQGGGDGPSVTEVGGGTGAETPRGADASVVEREAGLLELPADLLAGLAEHFQGDLRAENDLAVDALTEAVTALQGAVEAITNALAMLHSDGTRRARREPGDSRRYRMGPKNLERLELMKAHRHDDLPEQITPARLAAFLHDQGEPGVTEAAAGNVLWVLERNGVMVKTARGVYGWAE